MGIWRSFTGVVTVEIVSAALPQLLSKIAEKGVPLQKVTSVDELTVRCKVSRNCYHHLENLTEAFGAKITVQNTLGMFWEIRKLLKRPVLVLGFAIMLFLILFLPSRILFIEVEGNRTVPSRLILEKADACGVQLFAKRELIRSEKVKNMLLESVSELQWVGVNTKGCVAVISVQEKVEDNASEKQPVVSSIVAKRDGIIRSCTVLRGNAVCAVGQAVKAGQILVSGYTDCGLTIRATNAQAEIMAQTNHDVYAVTPAKTEQRCSEISRDIKISVKVGKKLIKFYKDSGISDATCVKIYRERKLTLPGGFQLPISLVTEEIIRYDTEELIFDESTDLSWISENAQTYILDQMIAGQIIQKQESLSYTDGACILTGQYACLEMIGRVRIEELIQNDGKSN